MSRPFLSAMVVVALAVAASAAPPAVLRPSDGHRASGTGAWLVFRSEAAPVVSVDGKEIGPPVAKEGVYHVRLEGLRPRGSQVEVRESGAALRLTVLGLSEAPQRFHRQVPSSCRDCHEMGEAGCLGCHRWAGAKHAPVLAAGCVRCHKPSAWENPDIAPVCAECHPGHRGGKHPRLRHPISAARDPLRPGRKLGCASCHDPHAPVCLSCLGREDLRQWCKRCHARP